MFIRRSLVLNQYYVFLMVLLCLFIPSNSAASESERPENAALHYFSDKVSAYQKKITLYGNLAQLESTTYHGELNILQNILLMEYKIQKSIDNNRQKLLEIDQVFSEKADPSRDLDYLTAINKLKRNRVFLLDQIGKANILLLELEALKPRVISEIKRKNIFTLEVKTGESWRSIQPALFKDITFMPKAFISQLGLDNLFQASQLVMVGLFLAFYLLIWFLMKMASSWVQGHKKNFPKVVLMLPSLNLYVPIVSTFLCINLCWYSLSTETASIPLILQAVNVLLLYCLIALFVKIDMALRQQRHAWLSLKTGLFSTFLFLVLCYNWFMTAASFQNQHIPFEIIEIRGIFIVCVILFILTYIITRNRKSFAEPVVIELLQRIHQLAPFAVIGYFIYIAWLPNNATQVLHFRDSIFLILMNMAFLWLNWLIFKLPFMENLPKGLQYLCKILLIMLYTMPIVAAISGYHHFALLFIIDLWITATTLVIIKGEWVLLNSLYSFCTNKGKAVGSFLYRHLHTAPKKITELSIIFYLAIIPILFFSFIALSQLWGVSLSEIEVFYERIHAGILLEQGARLYPIRIIRAFITFCFIMLISRIGIGSYTQRADFSSNGAKNLMQSFFHYTMLFIAVVAALIVAGVSGSSLLVISGGLSIGLGFSLKQFTENGTSGIYIAANRSYKIGDYITVNSLNSVSGTVKRIGLFSTQIVTDDHADVIIPNSSITGNSLTNYTFNNNKYRIKITVIPEHDEDTQSTKKLLMDIAKANPHVIQKKNYRPTVNLESNHAILSCEIADFHKKETIRSELILAITDAFHEHKIPIKLG